jgi:hypothetical protein
MRREKRLHNTQRNILTHVQVSLCLPPQVQNLRLKVKKCAKGTPTCLCKLNIKYGACRGGFLSLPQPAVEQRAGQSHRPYGLLRIILLKRN